MNSNMKRKKTPLNTDAVIWSRKKKNHFPHLILMNSNLKRKKRRRKKSLPPSLQLYCYCNKSESITHFDGGLGCKGQHCPDFTCSLASLPLLLSYTVTLTLLEKQSQPTKSGRCITHAVLIHKELDLYKSFQKERKKGQNFLSSICIFLQEVKLNLHLY